MDEDHLNAVFLGLDNLDRVYPLRVGFSVKGVNGVYTENRQKDRER